MKRDAIDAAARFMEALRGVTDPKAKRKIIGREFVHVFPEEAAGQPIAKWAAQATIHPGATGSAGAKCQSRRLRDLGDPFLVGVLSGGQRGRRG